MVEKAWKKAMKLLNESAPSKDGGFWLIEKHKSWGFFWILWN